VWDFCGLFLILRYTIFSSFVPVVCAVILATVIDIDNAQAEMNEFCPREGVDDPIQAPSIKIVSLNVSHGRKRALNQLLVSRKRTYKNLDEIAVLLQKIDADFVALQEADAPSRWSGKFDHVAYLLEQTDYSCFVHGHQAKNWLYTFGTALLSRVQMSDEMSHRFTPSPPTATKGFVVSTVPWATDKDTVPLTVVSVHLDFLRKKVRAAQIESMILALSDLETPLIIAGDLNGNWSVENSPVKALTQGLMLQAYEPEQPDMGTYRKASGKRLDWILISQQLQFIDYAVLPDVVSDHNAIYAEIGFLGR